MRTRERLRIVLQKQGRLSDESFKLLERCGIKLARRQDKLFLHAENFPLDVLLVRDDDIPALIMDGICDWGIIGENVLQEKILQGTRAGTASQLRIVMPLSFGYCRLSIAVPAMESLPDLVSLNGKRIATSYPNLVQQFFQQHQLSADIIELSGCVEIAPRLGIADAIADLVATGATLESHGLREIVTMTKSQAVLIQNQQSLSKNQEIIADLLQRRIEGVLRASEAKYIMLHAPREKIELIVQLLPCAERPTILPLQDEVNKVAVHAVCAESIFWDTLERLKMCGASSILVLPVEKMMI